MGNQLPHTAAQTSAVAWYLSSAQLRGMFGLFASQIFQKCLGKLIEKAGGGSLMLERALLFCWCWIPCSSYLNSLAAVSHVWRVITRIIKGKAVPVQLWQAVTFSEWLHPVTLLRPQEAYVSNMIYFPLMATAQRWVWLQEGTLYQAYLIMDRHGESSVQMQLPTYLRESVGGNTEHAAYLTQIWT